MTLDAALANEAFGYLTTTGRVSGKAHEVEIWFALEGNVAYLMNGDSKYSAGNADWVRNIKKRAEVTFRIAGHTFEGEARLVTEADEDRLARRLLLAKYARVENRLESWGQVAVPVAIELRI